MVFNWQEYLEYLHSKLMVLVRVVHFLHFPNWASPLILSTFKDDKACFSRVGTAYDQDYTVTFADCQNLQLLRQKLLRTSSVLDSSLDVAKGCANHCLDLVGLKIVASSTQAVAEIENHIEQLKRYRQMIDRIIQQSAGTNHLVRHSYLFPLIRKTQLLTKSFCLDPTAF